MSTFADFIASDSKLSSWVRAALGTIACAIVSGAFWIAWDMQQRLSSLEAQVERVQADVDRILEHCRRRAAEARD